MSMTARAYAKPSESPAAPAPRRRARRSAKSAMPSTLRMGLLLGLPLALIIAYVGLTAQLAAQTYRLSTDRAQEAKLMLTNNELRAQVGQLESLGRLEAAAAKLHMTVPKSVSVLMMPGAPKPEPQNTALAFVARLLHVR
jgi:predicted lipid-binding transport protein (Tim44 family)